MDSTMVQVAWLSPSQTIWHKMPLYKSMVRAPSKQDLKSFKIFLKGLFVKLGEVIYFIP